MGLDPVDPRWASDGTYVTTPSSGQQDEGWKPGERAPAQLINWLFATIRAWIVAIKVWAGYGLIRWQERIVVGTDSGVAPADASFSVSVGGAYVAKVATGYGSLNPTGAVALGLSDVEGSPSALSPDSWYYVYAYLDGSALAYQISGVWPSGLFKNGGDNTHLYLGAFKTTITSGVPGFGISIGFPYPQIRSGRWVHYQVTGGNRALFEIDHQTAPAPGTAKVIDCSSLITPNKGARVAKVNIFARESSGIDPVALYVNGLGGRVALWLDPGMHGSCEMVVELDSSGRFSMQADAVTIEWWVVFLGFEERQ